MRRTGKRNMALSAAGILLCLVLVTTFLVSGLLAKFVSGDGSKGAARTAKFAVSGSGFSETVNLDVSMKPGEHEDRSFTVTNNSEVSVRYTLTLRNTTKNLPLQLKVGGTVQADFDTDAGYVYTSTMPPNDGSVHSLDISLVWPDTPAENTDVVYSGQLDNIAVTVTAVQID